MTLAHSFVGVAQLVEHITHKDKVTSSILVVDTNTKARQGFLFGLTKDCPGDSTARIDAVVS